jgi:hypothetical protein
LEHWDKIAVMHVGPNREFNMGAGYFVIAILGCADGGSACTPVATLPTRYESERQCAAAAAPALEANSNFDYPTLLARCRQGTVKTGARTAPRHPPSLRAVGR